MLDDLDGVAVRVADPCDQQPAKPLVRRFEPMDSIRGELRVGLFGVVRPEDHRRPLALGYRPEAAVLASGSHRRDPDLVAVEDEVDVNRVTSVGSRRLSEKTRPE